jgi:endonuclease/exonuclease/phosphatase (EEP) superfamily protein YafD
LIAHICFTGRIWLWNIFSVIPPILFVLVPLALLAWALIVRDWMALVISLAVLLLGWSQTDLNIYAFLPHRAPATSASTIKVFNWNTRFWNEEQDADFYSFLQAQNADIYQLQEYWDRNGRALDLRPELEKAFPGYQVAISDELVTASRLPVLAQHGDVPGRFLRVDVRAGDRVLSFYNVHISMQLGADMAGIFRNRQGQFSRLQSDLAQNANPSYVSGDFNSTTSMGVMRWLLGHYQDSAQAGAAFIPRTWAFHLLPELRLWRLDFNLVDPRLAVTGYQDIDPGAKSDHWAQLVQIGYMPYGR